MIKRSDLEDLDFFPIKEKYPWQLSNGILLMHTIMYSNPDTDLTGRITIKHQADNVILFDGRLETKAELITVLAFISR